MRLAPLVPLPQGGLRYRLTYLMSDLGTYIFGPATFNGEPVEVLYNLTVRMEP